MPQLRFQLTINIDEEFELPIEHDQFVNELEIWAGEIHDLPFSVASIEIAEILESDERE